MKNAIQKALGMGTEIIHRDYENSLVISKRNNYFKDEFMIHNFYQHEDGSFFFENGNYCIDSFDDIVLKYLQRKNIEHKIEIQLSEEDLSDLQNGKQFEWTFRSDRSMFVNAKLKREDMNEEEISSIEYENLPVVEIEDLM